MTLTSLPLPLAISSSHQPLAPALTASPRGPASGRAEGMQIGGIVGGEAALLLEDDVASFGSRAATRDELVDLLLVLDHREFHLRVVEHVRHFLGDGVLVDRHRLAPRLWTAANAA